MDNSTLSQMAIEKLEWLIQETRLSGRRGECLTAHSPGQTHTVAPTSPAHTASLYSVTAHRLLNKKVEVLSVPVT